MRVSDIKKGSIADAINKATPKYSTHPGFGVEDPRNTNAGGKARPTAKTLA